MTELIELAVPRKRNVKDLTVTIAALESGDQVSATFFTERFGAFNLTGEARLSPAIGAFTVAGRAIEQNLKPDKTLQTLQAVGEPSETADAEGMAPEDVDREDVSPEEIDPEGTAPEDVYPEDVNPGGVEPGDIDLEDIDPEDRAPEPALPFGDLSAVEELGHGDLVRAAFHDPAYGNFTVTGVAVFSRVGTMYLVGEWILSINQSSAPRLRQIEIVAPAGSHPHPVPATITTVEEDED